MKLYAISKIFYSVQSEGVHAGLPAVFIRFGRCNPQTRREPSGFDWDDVVPLRDRMTANEVAKLARICNFRCRWVVLTGSEPEAQLDSDLVDALRGVGFYIAVETAGTAALDHVAVDWLTISSKPGEELRVKTADEVKYTVRYGDPIPSAPLPARNYILMPALDGDQFDKRNLEWCRELVKHNPPWQLSVQTGRMRTGKW
jgi:7-carboxy-7-deazaguanine synthase